VAEARDLGLSKSGAYACYATFKEGAGFPPDHPRGFDKLPKDVTVVPLVGGSSVTPSWQTSVAKISHLRTKVGRPIKMHLRRAINVCADTTIKAGLTEALQQYRTGAAGTMKQMALDILSDWQEKADNAKRQAALTPKISLPGNMWNGNLNESGAEDEAIRDADRDRTGEELKEKRSDGKTSDRGDHRSDGKTGDRGDHRSDGKTSERGGHGQKEPRLQGKEGKSRGGGHDRVGEERKKEDKKKSKKKAKRRRDEREYAERHNNSAGGGGVERSQTHNTSQGHGHDPDSLSGKEKVRHGGGGEHTQGSSSSSTVTSGGQVSSIPKKKRSRDNSHGEDPRSANRHESSSSSNQARGGGGGDSGGSRPPKKMKSDYMRQNMELAQQRKGGSSGTGEKDDYQAAAAAASGYTREAASDSTRLRIPKRSREATSEVTSPASAPPPPERSYAVRGYEDGEIAGDEDGEIVDNEDGEINEDGETSSGDEGFVGRG